MNNYTLLKASSHRQKSILRRKYFDMLFILLLVSAKEANPADDGAIEMRLDAFDCDGQHNCVGLVSIATFFHELRAILSMARCNLTKYSGSSN